MATNLPWGESILVTMELGFPVNVFTLGDYSTKVTRTNLVTNPSFETNTTGWTAVGTGTTIARITTDAYVGSACAQVNKGAVANGRISLVGTAGLRIPVTAGQPYYVSAYVKVPSGQSSCSLRIRTSEYRADGTQNSAQVSAPTVVSDGDGWVRLSFADTPTGGATPTVTMIYAVEETTTNARVYLVDACLFEQSSTLRPYFDGSYDAGWSGYILDGALSWSGTADASTSSGTWGLIGTEVSVGTGLDGSILDADILDGDLLGDDVSEYTKSITINRGRQDQLSNFSAGNATITLLNNDRRFDPTNQSSPYWDSTLGQSGVTPRRKVTVVLGGETLFVGRITDIDLSYATGKNSDISDVVVSVADDFVLLANAYTEADLTPVAELSGARLNYLLALPEVDYQGTTSVGTGTAVLGAYQIDANTNALTYAQAIAEAEQGFFFVARDGTLTFTDRVTAAFAASVGDFSDADGTGIKYQELSILYGQEFLYNKVVATREGGTPQTSDDATSQAEYGISTLSLTNLLLETDAAAQTLANELLNLYAEPAYRFEGMVLALSAFSSGDRTTCNQLELGDTITVERNYQTGTPATVTKYQTIERLRHTITPSAHRLEIAMSDAYIIYPLVLNDATFGTLDADNALS